MKVVCAWCKKVLPDKAQGNGENRISHGICSACAIDLTSFRPRTAKELLNHISEPVLLIDSDGIVKAGNHSASKLFGKELSQISGDPPGDIFECVHATEPGGCGGTVHCKTCTIRNTVQGTLKTGKSYENVPAFQNLNIPSGAKTMHFHISTEKIGESLLLRIDDADEAALR